MRALFIERGDSLVRAVTVSLVRILACERCFPPIQLNGFGQQRGDALCSTR